MFEKKFKYELYNYTIYNLIENNKRVLDIGCATGRLLERLNKDKNCDVFGIEVDKVMFGEAKRRCTNVILRDIERDEELPYPEKFFDVIVFADTLEHLRRPDEVLKKINKYLKDDGYILVSIPNIAFLSVRLGIILGKFDYAEYGPLDKTHLRFFTLKTARRLIEDSGYKIVKISTHCQVRMRYFLIRILSRVWKSLFAIDFIIKAIKQ